MPLSVAAVRLLVAVATDAITADINTSDFSRARNRAATALDAFCGRPMLDDKTETHFHLNEN